MFSITASQIHLTSNAPFAHRMACQRSKSGGVETWRADRAILAVPPPLFLQRNQPTDIKLLAKEAYQFSNEVLVSCGVLHFSLSGHKHHSFSASVE